ncbi:MAG: hypothetical protein A2X25_00535 [Chloroflexi bacterium GWB2_49_20]|nr:MAG: hypothetical protein A2X25_00535 [Chloroflexi bacterium GWB2_49_20]OGN80166.1 MAG: hypothetical protein A2X26_09390 [Chloroflexi bacterium GWC2_49_37]OGN83139.1 MAG: hypothetical protein A2X27_13150 [Chloroflexi bacterium GWD2_49_16]
MKIRSITYFCNPGWPLDEKQLRLAADFLKDAKSAFEAADYEVQTTRLATIPFPLLLGDRKIHETPRLAEILSQSIQQAGIAYAALGPALPETPQSYDVIPDAIAASKDIFFSGVMADTRSRISLQAVQACARVIVRCAKISADGFANLRFAALANVAPGTPFFPASYHEGANPAFAIATEAADLAVHAFKSAGSVEAGQQDLIAALEQHAHRLMPVADLLKYKYGVRFGGIDFSLAPFPEASRSLGAALEALGVGQVGWHGSLASAAILTEAIERADFPHTGFCGLMLPVLEDATLAGRAADGSLTVKDLLMYSAVCGTGLDTVPLPGDVTAEQIQPLLLDLAALALRLNKPLTARLMPIPGRQVGDMTEFYFPFFANSKVMALDSQALHTPLRGSETFHLESRKGN